MIRRPAWRTAASLTALTWLLSLCAAPAAAQETGAAAGSPAAPAQPEAHFDIRAFQVKGNTILPADAVERAIYPYTGPGRTGADVEAARAALQKAFEARGYVAVSVLIPEQSVESGILMLEVQPQAIGQVLVEGDTKHAARVKAMAPSLAPGQTPNLPQFQCDVIAMNQRPTRKVTPEMRTGVAPGTLDVVLKVDETSPIHASAELNNFSSAATTDLRAAGTLRYDDLWGRGDSISVSAQVAPRRPKDATVLSGNYLFRLGAGTQLLFYGVHSDSDIAVVGGTSVIGKGYIAGFRFVRSLGSKEGFYNSLTLGLDYKDFKEDVILGADRAGAPIRYVPVTASWRGDWTGDRRNTDLTLSTTFGIRGLGDGWERFDAKRYLARPSFLALKVDGSHTQDILGSFQYFAHLTGQWSPDPLISNEQFSLGGMQSVRGYYESAALGDWGAAIQTELRTPDLAHILGSPLKELRLRAFYDVGIAGIHDPLPGQKDRFRAMSVGLGGSVRLFDYLNGAVDVGTPLISNPDSKSGDIFARFRIWGEF